MVLQVKESLRWTAEGHRHSQKRVLVENTMPASALPGLTKKSFKGEAKAAINLDAAKSGAQRFIQARLPWDALESYQGQLMSGESMSIDRASEQPQGFLSLCLSLPFFCRLSLCLSVSLSLSLSLCLSLFLLC